MKEAPGIHASCKLRRLSTADSGGVECACCFRFQMQEYSSDHDPLFAPQFFAPQFNAGERKRTLRFSPLSGSVESQVKVPFLSTSHNYLHVAMSHTPPKTNMEPKNWWFVVVSPIPRVYFRFHVNFQGCIFQVLFLKLS